MIIIFRGPSGGGKTTLSNYLADKSGLQIDGPSSGLGDYLSTLKIKIRQRLGGGYDGPIAPVFSADDYHVQPDGTYAFDPAKLSAAHGDCLARFTKTLVDDARSLRNASLIVDNTNCSIAEVAPYAAQANAFGLELHIITLVGDPVQAWRRNRHGTPLTHVMKQDLVLRQSILEWPPWWPQQVFPA